VISDIVKKWLLKALNDIKAVDLRYGDEFYIPSVDEAKKTYNIAIIVKNYIFEKLEIIDEDLIII